MKKFTKVFLIISCVILLIGVICCLISFILGAKYNDVSKAMLRAGVNCNIDGITIDSRIDFDESLDEPVELNKSMNLSMDIGGAELIFEKSDNGKFYVESKGIKTAWSIDDDEIIVQTGRHRLFWNNNNSGKITIYVPEDYTFNDVEIDCGAGVIQIDDMTSDTIELNLGAGEIIAENIDTGELNVECGAGSIEMSGSVRGSADIECSMGSVDLDVTQEEKYYNYEINCSMGEVNINNDSYSGMGVERNIDNDSDYEMSIECSMGEINITTN